MNGQQLVLDVAEAARRRDEGMQRAEDSAEFSMQHWSDLAFAAVKSHAMANLYFTIEDVRAAFPNVPAPPEPRAWGGVTHRAKLAGVMVYDRHVKAQSVTVHRMDVKQWKSLIFQGDR